VNDVTLVDLAAACILAMANSSTPRAVLTDYFQRAYSLGWADTEASGVTQADVDGAYDRGMRIGLAISNEEPEWMNSKGA
jgi:hypothetical protein